MAEETSKPLFLVEDHVSHDELKKMFRREVNEKYALLDDLHHLPKLPSKRTMGLLGYHVPQFLDTQPIINQLHKDHPIRQGDDPFPIPFKMEHERGAAFYTLIRNGLMALKKDITDEEDNLRNTDGSVDG